MPLQKVSNQRRALSLLKTPLPSCRLCCAVLLLAWPARRRGASSACQRRTLVFYEPVCGQVCSAAWSCVSAHLHQWPLYAPRAEGQKTYDTLQVCTISAQQRGKPSARR